MGQLVVSLSSYRCGDELNGRQEREEWSSKLPAVDRKTLLTNK